MRSRIAAAAAPALGYGAQRQRARVVRAGAGLQAGHLRGRRDDPDRHLVRARIVEGTDEARGQRDPGDEDQGGVAEHWSEIGHGGLLNGVIQRLMSSLYHRTHQLMN